MSGWTGGGVGVMSGSTTTMTMGRAKEGRAAVEWPHASLHLVVPVNGGARLRVWCGLCSVSVCLCLCVTVGGCVCE